MLYMPVTSPLLRASVLLLKLLSLLQPCVGAVYASPAFGGKGTVNAVVVYPLMVLAVLEFSLLGRPRVWKSVVLGVGHAVAVMVLLRRGVLCGVGGSGSGGRAGGLVWEGWEVGEDDGGGGWRGGEVGG